MACGSVEKEEEIVEKDEGPDDEDKDDNDALTVMMMRSLSVLLSMQHFFS